MSLFKLGYNIIREDSVDKFLLLFDKPIHKILNRNISLYHGSCYDIKEKELAPKGINVGATPYSNPRWSTFFWDSRDLAIKWAMECTIGKRGSNFTTVYIGQNDKVLVCDNGPEADKDIVFDRILKEHDYVYVYTVVVPASKVEVGSSTVINEYTVSETVKIHKKEKIKITRNLLEKYFTVISESEMDYILNNVSDMFGTIKHSRNIILSKILDEYRDMYRLEIRRELKAGNINYGDDISHFKKQINEMIKNDSYNLRK